MANTTAALAVEPACLSYEPALVAITGKLERQTYPGPPNYESVEKGDKAETGFYLSLATPICVNATPDDDLNYEQRDVRLVQLNLDDKGFDELRPYLGGLIEVRGTLYAAHTGHHHAPLVLNYSSGRQTTQ
jgi:hypothetical protein